MNKLSLKAEKREIASQGCINQLRRNGLIPAIIYGHQSHDHKKNAIVSVEQNKFNELFQLSGQHRIIELDITGDKKYDVLVKSYQTSPVQKEIIHIDFFEIDKTKKLKAKIPIKISGLPKGIKRGGVLEHMLHKLAIESLPQDVPMDVQLDVTPLGVGDSIRVSDLNLGDKIKVLSSSKQAIAAVSTSRATRLADEEERDVETK